MDLLVKTKSIPDVGRCHCREEDGSRCWAIPSEEESGSQGGEAVVTAIPTP